MGIWFEVFVLDPTASLEAFLDAIRHDWQNTIRVLDNHHIDMSILRLV